MKSIENSRTVFSLMGYQIWSSSHSKFQVIEQVQKPKANRSQSSLFSSLSFDQAPFKKLSSGVNKSKACQKQHNKSFKHSQQHLPHQFQKKGNINFKVLKQGLIRNQSCLNAKTRTSTIMDQQPICSETKNQNARKYSANAFTELSQRINQFNQKPQQTTLNNTKRISKISLKSYSCRSGRTSTQKNQLKNSLININQNQVNLIQNGLKRLFGVKQVLTLYDDDASDCQSKLDIQFIKNRKAIKNLNLVSLSQPSQLTKR